MFAPGHEDTSPTKGRSCATLCNACQSRVPWQKVNSRARELLVINVIYRIDVVRLSAMAIDGASQCHGACCGIIDGVWEFGHSYVTFAACVPICIPCACLRQLSWACVRCRVTSAAYKAFVCFPPHMLSLHILPIPCHDGLGSVTTAAQDTGHEGVLQHSRACAPALVHRTQ